MARVNIVKRIKINGRWVMRSIPRKQSGNWDWNSLPDGRYYVEWYEQGSRRREPAGTTVAQALEVQRRRRHLAEGQALGLRPGDARPTGTRFEAPAPSSRRPASRSGQHSQETKHLPQV